MTLTAQSQRHKRATDGHQLAKVRAVAADPHLYSFAAAVTEANQRNYRVVKAHHFTYFQWPRSDLRGQMATTSCLPN